MVGTASLIILEKLSGVKGVLWLLLVVMVVFGFIKETLLLLMQSNGMKIYVMVPIYQSLKTVLNLTVDIILKEYVSNFTFVSVAQKTQKN